MIPVSSRLRRGLSLAAWLAVAFAVLAVAVRLTVRDRLPLLAVVYYATPAIVTAALLGVAALVFLALRRRAAAVAAALASILCAVWWVSSAFVAAGDPAAPADVRVLLWNTFYGGLGWPGIEREAAAPGADLVILVETVANDEPRQAIWRERLPGYDVRSVDGRMIVMARGVIHSATRGELGGDGCYGVWQLTLQGRPLTVIVVDVRAKPLRHRRAVYRMLEPVLAPYHNTPALVAGDFNTPPDSVFLAPLRRHFVNAFEAAGHGLHTTWPVPLPAIAIDHVWLAPALRPVNAVTLPTWRSDHRPLLVGFDWADDAPAERESPHR